MDKKQAKEGTMNTLSKKFGFYGAILMALAITLGAFGAHGLKKIITPEMLIIFHTGVEYHFYHALGLFAVSFVGSFSSHRYVKTSGYLMLFGILVFSGSLYIMTITGLKWLGAITPIGGTAFIIAWILLALSIKKG